MKVAVVYHSETGHTKKVAELIRDGDQAQQERARIFGERVAQKALELFGGK
ncbi:MAG: flavodoxin family protein [Deltaproteobacteria bacterium]|nr:flavodoxin family protein [Deltaproteobacteria bacterium]